MRCAGTSSLRRQGLKFVADYLRWLTVIQANLGPCLRRDDGTNQGTRAFLPERLALISPSARSMAAMRAGSAG